MKVNYSSVLLVGAFSLVLSTAMSVGSVRAEDVAHPHAQLPSATVQGEYVGDIKLHDETVKHGVQIIARGDDKYEGVAYVGGLPDEGWDGEKPRRYQGKKTEAHAASFETDEYTATIDDGVLTVLDAEGKPAGTLKRVVRASPTLGAKPPEGATVLFQLDGTNDFPKSKVDPGLGLRENVTSATKIGDGTLHLEFMLPLEPAKSGQGRGNSGVYLQGRYEVQVLDSFGLEGLNNECGGIYGIAAPKLNMCLPPLQWQTYDIDFQAAKYEDGKQVAPPSMTVRHNGVLIHENQELPRTTTASPVKAGPEPGPLYLQGHGSMMVYRNVWFLPKQ